MCGLRLIDSMRGICGSRLTLTSAPVTNCAFVARRHQSNGVHPPTSQHKATPPSASDEADVVRISESPLQNVCLMEMNSPKANVLTPQLISRLLSAIREVCDPDAPQRYHGIILTSRVPGIFSAGLDVNELLHASSQDRFVHYWNQFQQLFVTLHTLPVPLAVAVNGHALAGGTVLALAADYRVMSRSRADAKMTSIGIAVTRYGIRCPPYVAGSMAHVVGFRRAEDLLVNGRTLSAEEAREVGLVDHVVENHDEAVVPCLEYMEQVLALPSPLPFWVVKDSARKKLVAPLCTQALRSVDTMNFFEMLQNPVVRRTLGVHTKSIGSAERH